MASITIQNLQKNFNGQQILNGINLEFPSGTTTVILGKSGQGKSVLLKHIVGLIEPDEGSIIIDGINITEMATKQRQHYLQLFGYVFQFAALLDSLTIYENMALPLREQKKSETEIKNLIEEKLNLVHLDDNVLYRFPSEISGGMRKRVGLARTLLNNPSVILYDEPTTGLDPITTHAIHELIRDMQKKLCITSIVISHDLSVFDFADNIAFLHEGQIQWQGSAKEAKTSKNPYMNQFTRGLLHGPLQNEAG
jgi:phospholipid/cholesterol/gamma-HCH transport system ATP-binding protein